MRLTAENTALLDTPRELYFGNNCDINATFPSLVIRCLPESSFRN